MSADRELLELAAKAAGFEFVQWTAGTWTFGKETQCRPNGGDVWNPLEDDGDALRLSIDLEIYPTQTVMAANVYLHRPPDIHSWSHSEPHNNGNRYAATRRAIVRAAAEIGRNMKGEAA